MTDERLRKAARKRLERRIVARIDDFPRQHAALESAMAAFGDEFDLARFKRAFETSEDIEAYNDVQAVERAIGRVQGYVAEMAMDGVRLVGLPSDPAGGEGFRATHAFEALRDAKLIDAGLCRRLARAQKGRSQIEHEYPGLRAGRVHDAAILIRETSLEFFTRFRAWIEPHLTAGQ
jgi:hypothetical protein